jgi:hypothetical protein
MGVLLTLDHLLELLDHVVAQVVKAKFIVGAVGDISGIGISASNWLKMLESLITAIIAVKL